MEQMIKVQIEGKEYEYPAGTTYQTIAGDFLHTSSFYYIACISFLKFPKNGEDACDNTLTPLLFKLFHQCIFKLL